MRNYEMLFVVDPRLTDEEFVSLSDEYKQMITAGGAEVVAEESWGRRKLAYSIQKLNEGRYMLFYVAAEGRNPLPDVERRLRQNEKVLRFLTVRTDGVRRPGPTEADAGAPPPRRGGPGRYEPDQRDQRGHGEHGEED